MMRMSDSDQGPPDSRPSEAYGLQRIIGNDAAPRAASKQLWLDAWQDPVAGLAAYTPCIHTCNLMGDDEYRLFIADGDRKLKVWKGTQKVSEHALLDVPTAITSFVFVVETSGPRLPALAVAAGAHIYIYRSLRPYYKFVLPPENVNTEEQDLWQRTMEGDLVIGEAVAGLTRLQDGGVILTTRSLQLMNIADPAAKMRFAEQWQSQPLMSTTVITCMDVIKLAIDEPGALSSLVVGTESGRVLILNNSGTAVVKNVWIGIAPAFLAISGELDVAYTITVAGRDGKLYIIRNGELSQTIIQLEAQAVGLVRLNKSVVVGCMNDVVHSYQSSGHKNYSIYLPAPILTLQKLELVNNRNSRCLAVALSNGEVRVYRDKTLVSLHTAPSRVSGLCFGRYGREDNTLITVCKSGSLDIKIMPRTASIESGGIGGGPPPEQDIPLQVPKKTRLFVEQTQRERDAAADMHRTFQRDLAKLRLTTARAYVKVLTDGQGQTAFTSSANLSLNLSVHGLGPRFKLIMTVRNEGSTPVKQVPIMLQCDRRLYRPSVSQLLLPLLVPSLSYTYEIAMECLDPEGGSDTITVILAQRGSNLPVLQAQVRMPISELDAE